MGGCCCCSSRRSQLDGTPVYYYYCPQALEENESLTSSHQGTASALSTGLLVDINLETSIPSFPDTYRPPPVPMPYDSDFGRPQTPQDNPGSHGNKINPPARTIESNSSGETNCQNSFETLPTCVGIKESGGNGQTDVILASPKESDVELSKSSEPIVSIIEEEDACPICLEEYDAENPRIITKCEHHFHLSCILEWMERSDTCPVCDQETIFNHTFSG